MEGRIMTINRRSRTAPKKTVSDDIDTGVETLDVEGLEAEDSRQDVEVLDEDDDDTVLLNTSPEPPREADGREVVDLSGLDVVDRVDADNSPLPDAGGQIEIDPTEPRNMTGDVVLQFMGPPKSYTVGDVRFRLNEIKSVPARYVRPLLSTGYFRRETQEALEETLRMEEANVIDQGFPVGRFETKRAAYEYARDIHRVELDPNTSLRQMNAQTLELAQKARASRDDGVETVD